MFNMLPSNPHYHTKSLYKLQCSSPPCSLSQLPALLFNQRCSRLWLARLQAGLRLCVQLYSSFLPQSTPFLLKGQHVLNYLAVKYWTIYNISECPHDCVIIYFWFYAYISQLKNAYIGNCSWVTMCINKIKTSGHLPPSNLFGDVVLVL